MIRKKEMKEENMKKKQIKKMEFLNIRMVLDRSGSMNLRIKDTIDSINAFIQDQKDNKIFGVLTLSTFDTISIDVPIYRQEIEKLQELDYDFLKPRAGTPLLDAIGIAIHDLENNPVKEDEKKVLVIVTDGYENSSREYNPDTIRDLIRTKTEEGWLIVYLGADHDAIIQSRRYGFEYEKSLHYAKEDSRDAFKSVSRTIDDYSKGVNPKSIKFMQQERAMSNKLKQFMEEE